MRGSIAGGHGRTGKVKLPCAGLRNLNWGWGVEQTRERGWGKGKQGWRRGGEAGVGGGGKIRGQAEGFYKYEAGKWPAWLS